jgi:DNA repair protein RadC
VRQRLVEGGGDALLDHELIEYLLGLAIPRRDTKPIAKRLLKEFGGIGGLLSADAEAIQRNGGVGEGAAAALKIVQATALRLLREAVREAPVLSSWQALLDYLRADMGFMATERVRILHLNTRNMLIRDEVMAEGSIDQAAVSVREVIRRAIDLGSAAIILVHNHPSGDPSPSRADIALTRTIIDAGKPLGIGVHDHIIIGMNGHVSMRAQGLI